MNEVVKSEVKVSLHENNNSSQGLWHQKLKTPDLMDLLPNINAVTPKSLQALNFLLFFPFSDERTGV